MKSREHILGLAVVAGLTGGLLAGGPAVAGDGQSPLNTGTTGVQLAQNNPFGGLFGGLMGGGANKSGGGNINPTGDPLANALRQIDVAEEIQAKAQRLQESVGRVIYTVKLYQALNGGIWYKLGLQLNDIYKLNDQAQEGWVREFIAASKAKRISGQNALTYVEINAVDDIKEQNHTISNNNGKIAVLRKSVSAYANAVAGQGSFETLVANQNIPLDEMMNAYLTHVEDITATMEGASMVFDDMSYAYENAVGDMDRAIATFNEQSGLVAAEVTKQIGILALEIVHMKNAIDNARDNPFQAIVVLAQGMSILSDLQKMQSTLSEFNEVKGWFDANSQEILAASRGARQELAASLDTMKTLRPTLTASWERQCVAVSQAAAKLRQETVAFEQDLEKVKARARAKAPAVQHSDMSELDSLMKKPRRLKKS